MGDNNGSRIKNVDMSDVKLLVVGVVFLLVPIIFLYYISGSTGRTATDAERARATRLRDRRQVFNFPSKSKTEPSPSRGLGRPSVTPRQSVEDEFKSAAQHIIERGRRVEHPPGTTREQREIYDAEHHPHVIHGNALFDRGDYRSAERSYQSAYDLARDNVFQKLYAVGGLLAVYEATGEYDKYAQSLQRFAQLVGKIPEDLGGGDLETVIVSIRDSISVLFSDAETSKKHEGAQTVELIADGHITLGEIEGRIPEILKFFPDVSGDL